jgi:magnesium transporter
VFGSVKGAGSANSQQYDEDEPISNKANENESQPSDLDDTAIQGTNHLKNHVVPSDVQRNEWEDINQRNFMELPFELLALDVVLESVVGLLATDALSLCKGVDSIIKSITLDTKAQNNYEKLRFFKDKVKETESRIKGFERALNQVLEEDEDMALMNLSKLITHPERFVFPTSPDILRAESDAPELIIESYLQQAFSASNSLELLNGKIATTEELVEIKLDTIRNRLLFVTTCLTLVTTILAACSLVGAIFGTNLYNGLEDSPTAFSQIWIGTMTGAFIIFILIFVVFWKKSTWLLQS